MLNKITEHLNKKIHKHVAKHYHHVHKFLYTLHHTHHTIIHMGELLIIGCIGFSSLIFANYSNSYEYLYRSNTEEIAQFLVQAMQQEKPTNTQSKIISVWEMDGTVNNTFAPGYCTYGAARISPEFFPYSEDKMNQQRTWGGNAIDRCENAEKTGYVVGSTPSEGALIVYKKTGSNTYFGHVGKVLYYNKSKQSLIIRDMNRLGLFTMTDRREDAANENIKCYIYNKKKDSVQIIPETSPTEITADTTGTIHTGNKEIILIQSTKGNTGTVQKELTGTDIQETQPSSDQTAHNAADQEPMQNQSILPKSTFSSGVQSSIYLNDSIAIDRLSDISKHFFNTYIIKITPAEFLQSKIGENILFTLSITSKETGEPYEGILPFIINIISNNINIENNISTLQLIHNGKAEFIFTGKEKGNSTILVTIEDQKAITFPVTIK